MNQIKIIKILKNGNCFYRCLSYFLLKSQEFYQNIKNLIIEWIENNYDIYLDFFGGDDANNLTKEMVQKEFELYNIYCLFNIKYRYSSVYI